jgi:hypothetical protein
LQERNAYPWQERNAYPLQERNVYPLQERNVYPLQERNVCPLQEKNVFPWQERNVCPWQGKNVCPWQGKNVYPWQERNVCPLQGKILRLFCFCRGTPGAQLHRRNRHRCVQQANDHDRCGLRLLTWERLLPWSLRARHPQGLEGDHGEFGGKPEVRAEPFDRGA